MKRFWLSLSSIVFTFATLFSQVDTQLEEEASIQLSSKGDHSKSTRFEQWVQKTIKKIENRSRVAATVAGPIEYTLQGDKGPVVIVFQGSVGGFDQSEVIGEQFYDDGYIVVSVSRPGYLRTPLSVGSTIEEQAAAIVALMDALNIPDAAIAGFSSGSAVAFTVARNFPNRVWALVLESIDTQPNDYVSFLLPNAIASFSSPGLIDFQAYLLYLLERFDFYSLVKEALLLDNTLPSSLANERIKYVEDHNDQQKFLKKYSSASIPLSPRLYGIINDMTHVGQWLSYDYAGFITPTVIVQSRYDSNGSYPLAQFANASIPGSLLITLEKAGHFIWLGTETKKWTEQVNNFLKENSKGAFRYKDAVFEAER